MIELRWLKKKDPEPIPWHEPVSGMSGTHQSEGETVLQMRRHSEYWNGPEVDWTEWQDIPVVEEE